MRTQDILAYRDARMRCTTSRLQSLTTSLCSGDVYYRNQEPTPLGHLFRRLKTLFSDFLRRITLAIGKEQAYQHAQCENSRCQSRHEDLTACKKRILVPWQSLQGQSFKQPTGTTSTPSFRWKAYFPVPVSTMRKDGTFILVTSIFLASLNNV